MIALNPNVLIPLVISGIFIVEIVEIIKGTHLESAIAIIALVFAIVGIFILFLPFLIKDSNSLTSTYDSILAVELSVAVGFLFLAREEAVYFKHASYNASGDILALELTNLLLFLPVLLTKLCPDVQSYMWLLVWAICMGFYLGKVAIESPQFAVISCIVSGVALLFSINPEIVRKSIKVKSQDLPDIGNISYSIKEKNSYTGAQGMSGSHSGRLTSNTSVTGEKSLASADWRNLISNVAHDLKSVSFFVLYILSV